MLLIPKRDLYRCEYIKDLEIKTIPRITQVSPEYAITRLLMRGRQRTIDTHGAEAAVKTEVGIGVMWPRVARHHKYQKRQEMDSPHSLWRGPADTLVLHFWPQSYERKKK